MVRRPIFRPFQHPRGPNGRFTESRTSRLDAKGKQRAAQFAARFSPRKVSGPDDASSYLSGLSATKGGPDPAVSLYLSNPAAVNGALRAGKPDGPDVAAVDGAMKPLPDDLQTFRRVPATAFGDIDPASLVGTKVRDAAYFPTTLAPARGDPTDVLLHLSVPAGTKAAPVPDLSTVVVDRGVDMAVTEATTRPDGGVDLHLMVMPDSVEPAGDTAEPGDPSGDVQPPTNTPTDQPAPRGGPLNDLLASLATADDPEALAQQFAEQVYNGDYAGFTVEVGSVLASDDGIVTRMTIRDADGTPVGSATRGLYRDDNGDLVADHTLLQLDASVRGRGLASAFNRSMEDWYRQQGVSRIELHANIDVGGYAWASHGYDFADADSADGVIDQFRNTIDTYRQRAVDLRADGDTAAADNLDAQIAQAQAVLDRADRNTFGTDGYPTPYQISQLGRTPGSASWLGRDAMMNSDWYGVRWL